MQVFGREGERGGGGRTWWFCTGSGEASVGWHRKWHVCCGGRHGLLGICLMPSCCCNAVPPSQQAAVLLDQTILLKLACQGFVRQVYPACYHHPSAACSLSCHGIHHQHPNHHSSATCTVMSFPSYIYLQATKGEFSHGLQGSEDRLQLTPLLSLGNTVTPDQAPPAGKGGQPLGDSLLRCGSNPLWWGLDQLAFVGPEGCLQVVQVPSGEQILYVDSHYFLPGSRIVASSAVYGRPRTIYVLSALIQAAKYVSEPLWLCSVVLRSC